VHVKNPTELIIERMALSELAKFSKRSVSGLHLLLPAIFRGYGRGKPMARDRDLVAPVQDMVR